MEKIQKKKTITDVIFSVAGLCIMNGVIQLVIYPMFNSKFGEEKFGQIIFLLSVISVFCAGFGIGGNYSRVLANARFGNVKGDYNIFILCSSVITSIVAFFALFYLGQLSFLYYITFALLFFATTLRFYSDAEYKISLNFKRYFVFYLLLTIGYLVGLVFTFISEYWTLVMLTGELTAFLFVLFTGSLYGKPRFTLKRSEHFKANLKSYLTLSFSQFLQNLILNIERVLILFFMGAASVSVFYTATLLGKIVALLAIPLNGIIIGYLSKYKIQVSAKLFSVFAVILLVLSGAICFLTVIASDIFVGIMYPNLFAESSPLFFFGNLGQIFFFTSTSLLVIIMHFTKDKYQIYINLVFCALYAAICIPTLIYGDLYAFSIAVVVVNFLRFLIIYFVGIYFTRKKALIEE